MTDRPAVRTHHFDFNRARTSLRDSVVATELTLGDGPGDGSIRVRPEPLLAPGHDGGLWQSILLESGQLGDDPKIEVLGRDGTPMPVEFRSAATGLRVLVPEVSAPTAVRIEFIDIGESVPVTLQPQRHWEVHLVHHSHLDIGYTDPQSRVIAEHVSFLDSALDLVRATDDWPDDARFRWSVEALWAFDLWRKRRPDTVVEEFVERVRQGRIELTALPFNMHTETSSTLELHELLRLVADVRTRYGLEITTAMQTDVPGAVAGLVDALAENGVRYLSVAHNWAGRSTPHLTGGDRVPRMFRWSSPSGNSVVVWVTDTPHGLSYMEGPMLGFDRSYDMVDDLLPAYLTSLATNPYPYDGNIIGWACSDAPLDREPYPWDLLHLRVQGRFGDNAPPRRVIAETVRRWNEAWVYPRLRMSSNTEFFAAAEERYGDELEVYSGDWNDWWADGVGSAARSMQLVREAQSVVEQATTVSAVAGLAGAPGAELDTDAAAEVHRDALLFDEHTWGAGNPWTASTAGFDSGTEQWQWKSAAALAAQGGAVALLQRATARLGAVRGAAADALASFEIVNTTGSPRAGVVQAFLPESRVPVETAVSVRDSRDGTLLPAEEIAQDNPNHRDAGRHLLIAVPDVPAIGSVRVDVLPAPGHGPDDVRAGSEQEASPPATVLDNGVLRVEVDLSRAGIASIVDLASGRDVVEQDATFAFNAYVYDRYLSGGELNHASGRLESDADLNLLGTRSLARPAALIERGRSPVRDWIVYESVADGARWVRTTLTLWHGQDRLEIDNRIAKNAVSGKESGYFAFPFHVDDPVVRAEITGAVAGTGIEAVPGGAEHMRAMRRWASLQDDRAAVAWVTRDVPLVEIGDIAVPYPPFPGTTIEREPATIYSWVHNNLWDTNFPSDQSFDTTFRYAVAVTPAADADSGPSLAARVADDVCSPLVAVLTSATGPTAAASSAWLSSSDERVRVTGVSSPRPDVILVRLASVSSRPLRTTLECGFLIESAQRTTMLGVPQARLDLDHPQAVGVDVAPFATTAVELVVRRVKP